MWTPFPLKVLKAAYRSRTISGESQIAVMWCGPITDIPPETTWLRNQLFASAQYDCTLIFYSCGTEIVVRQHYGMGRAHGFAWSIMEMYEYYKAQIEANVPATNTFIDLRTEGQLLNDCCPPMLYD